MLIRHKLLIAVPALAVVAATAAWFLAGQEPVEPTDAHVAPVADQTADAGTAKFLSRTTLGPGTPQEIPSPPTIAANEQVTAAAETTPEIPQAKREAYVAKRVAELQDLGMDNDAESLEVILSDLNNPEPDIRQAAVDAAVQFGSRDAIPRLLDAAAQTDDPEEKSALLDAVEFLKMPTLAEALAQTNHPAPPAVSGSRPHP